MTAGASQPMVVLVDSNGNRQAHERWAALVSYLEKLTADGVLKGFAAPLGLITSPDRVAENRQQLRAMNIDLAKATFESALQREGLRFSIRSKRMRPRFCGFTMGAQHAGMRLKRALALWFF